MAGHMAYGLALWLSYGFSIVSLWLAIWFSYGFPRVFLWFFYCFSNVFVRFSDGFIWLQLCAARGCAWHFGVETGPWLAVPVLRSETWRVSCWICRHRKLASHCKILWIRSLTWYSVALFRFRPWRQTAVKYNGFVAFLAIRWPCSDHGCGARLLQNTMDS